MNYRWVIKTNENENLVPELAKQLQIPNALAKVLSTRGKTDVDAANKFFNPEVNNLYDPFILKDMQKAVTRILDGINNEEQF